MKQILESYKENSSNKSHMKEEWTELQDNVIKLIDICFVSEKMEHMIYFLIGNNHISQVAEWLISKNETESDVVSKSQVWGCVGAGGGQTTLSCSQENYLVVSMWSSRIKIQRRQLFLFLSISFSLHLNWLSTQITMYSWLWINQLYLNNHYITKIYPITGMLGIVVEQIWRIRVHSCAK